MIYYVGYHDSEDHWTTSFNQAVVSELERRRLPYRELPPSDWATGPVDPAPYRDVGASSQDTWLIGWAQSAVVELLANLPGSKFAFVVGIYGMPFEPARLRGGPLRERERLAQLDGILCVSEWCRRSLLECYPELAGRCHVVGPPIDYAGYEPYLRLPKDPRLVVFNQRFCVEKLHFVEVEVARRLVSKGYQVRHLSGWKWEDAVYAAPGSEGLLLELARVGVRWVHNPTKDLYHQRLAGAGVVVTTSIADMLPYSLLEAIYLGAVPIAPRALCFEEFVHPDNLYTPYDVSEIVAKVAEGPVRQHRIEQYAKGEVMDRVLSVMQNELRVRPQTDHETLRPQLRRFRS